MARPASVGTAASRFALYACPRPGEEIGGGGFFHEPPRLHDGDTVRERRDDAEIVRDEQQRHVEVAAKFGDERENFRLDRDVERGRRLIREQEPRPRHERERERHALAHAAGEFMRKLRKPSPGVRQVHAPSMRRASAAPPLRQAVRGHRDFRELDANAPVRRQAAGRILEHETDAAAAYSPRHFRPPAVPGPSKRTDPRARPLAASSPTQAFRIWLLPEPDSPTIATLSLRLDRKVNAVHGAAPRARP